MCVADCDGVRIPGHGSGHAGRDRHGELLKGGHKLRQFLGGLFRRQVFPLRYGGFQAVEAALALFQGHFRLQFFQVQFCQAAALSDLLGLSLHMVDIPLDRVTGPVLPGPAAGRDLGFQDPILGQLLDPPGGFPQQLGDGGGIGPLWHRSGQHRRRRGLLLRCFFCRSRHLQHPLFLRRPDGPAGFAFRLVVDFAFLTSFLLDFLWPHPL